MDAWSDFPVVAVFTILQFGILIGLMTPVASTRRAYPGFRHWLGALWLLAAALATLLMFPADSGLRDGRMFVSWVPFLAAPVVAHEGVRRFRGRPSVRREIPDRSESGRSDRSSSKCPSPLAARTLSPKCNTVHTSRIEARENLWKAQGGSGRRVRRKLLSCSAQSRLGVSGVLAKRQIPSHSRNGLAGRSIIEAKRPFLPCSGFCFRRVPGETLGNPYDGGSRARRLIP